MVRTKEGGDTTMRFMGRNGGTQNSVLRKTPRAESRPDARSLGTKIIISLYIRTEFS